MDTYISLSQTFSCVDTKKKKKKKSVLEVCISSFFVVGGVVKCIINVAKKVYVCVFDIFPSLLSSLHSVMSWMVRLTS